MNVHYRLIYNNKKLETTQIFINRNTDKQIVVYSEKQITQVLSSMDEPQIMWSERSHINRNKRIQTM